MGVFQILITTTANVSSVHISIPDYNTSNRVSKYSTVYKNSYVLEDLGSAVCVEGDTIDTKAVIVTSEEDVAVSCFSSMQNSAGSFLAIPTEMLGCSYYVVVWSGDKARVVIIAIEDYTLVQVRLPSTISGYIKWNGIKYYSSDVISETLNRHEIWQLTFQADVSGFAIKANTFVGVISGNRKAKVGNDGNTHDHLVEMLTPVETWGMQFIAVSTPNKRVGVDRIKIVTSENNTDIQVKGDFYSHIIIPTSGSAETFVLDKNSSVYIEATKPIMVTQFGDSKISNDEDTDATMLLVAPLEQYGNKYSIAIINHTFNSYLLIVCPESELSGLRMNNTQITLQNQRNISTNSYVYITGYLEIEHGNFLLTHTVANVMFWAWVYGTGSKKAAYATPAGMHLASINPVKDVSIIK